jgi:hypothetical protein
MGGRENASWADRLLGLTGVEAPALAASKLRSFRRFLLLLVAAESWHALHYPAYREDVALHVGIAVGLSACAAAGLRPRLERAATALAALLMAVDLASVFPENANHQYVGLLAMIFTGLAEPGQPDEPRASVQALRWIVPIGFFWAGFQKLWWGYWFGGEFLALRVATDSGFAMALGPLFSADEYARLAALQPGRGAGPFRTDEPLLLFVSNAAWITEIALAPLLLIHRTRRIAALGVIAFVFAIEIAARELFFGMLMVSLALLYGDRDWNRPALPWLATAIALLLASSAGLLPAASFG